LVTIYPKPQASYNSITQDSCGPRFVNFINTSNPKNGEPITSLSNLWTINNINSTQKDTAHYFTNTGVIDSTFNTRLIVTTINGCKDTINNTITVKPDAKASFTVNNVTACAPFNITSSNIQLIEFAQANSAYEWYANNLFIGTGTAFPGFTINNQNDSVLIKLKAISLRGCKNDSMEVWFKTIENPKPNFVAIDSIGCSPSNVTFNNTSSPATGLGYKWEFGNATNQSLQKNPLFTFNNFGLFDTTVTVKLVVTAGITGCKDSITKQIIIKPSPNPNFIMSDTFLCYPNKLFVTNTSANIPPYNLTSFKWKAIGPDSSSIENDTANTTTSISFMDNKTSFNKSYVIRLLIKSDFGCLDSLEKTVEITTRPIASFNFNIDSGCAPISVNTNNVSQNASTYTWFSTNTNVSVNNPSLTNTSISFPSHKGIIDSSYHISLVAKTAFGCLDTTSKSFKAFPLPISIFTMDKDSGCSPLDVNFTNNSVTKKPSSSFWNYGNGTSQIKNDSTFLNNFVGSVFRDTSYTIKLITTSKDGCKDSIQKQIKIKASAFAKIKLNDTLICSNPLNPTKLRIENNSYGSVDTFYWDFGDGNTLMTTSDSTINHPYTNEGVFKITLRAVNNCKTTFDSATIKIQIPPNVNFTLSDTVGCGPLSVAFSNTSTNIFEAKYLWDLGNGNNSSQFNPPNASYVQSRVSDSTYLVSLSIFNACGAFIKYDTVRVLPKPIALFATSTDSGCSPLPVFFINQSLGLPTTYKWYFGNGDSSSRFTPLQSPIVYRTIDSISYFTIKLITTNSCGIDSIERPIKVFPNTVKSFFTTSGNTICQNSFVSFTDQSTGGSNISWNLGDGNSSSARNPVNKYTKPGIFYAYQYVNNGCSFDTSFVIINVN
jgi:PKD repeat protein